MTKTPKLPRDMNQWAKNMVDLATGNVAPDDAPASFKLAHYQTASQPFVTRQPISLRQKPSRHSIRPTAS